MSYAPCCRHPGAVAHGRRDYTMCLLLALYNTGARVQEILDLRPCDLQLEPPWQALLHGKGGKQRWCPLWSETVQAQVDLVTISRGRGHANLTTTGRYLAVDIKAKRTAVQQARPASTAETQSASWQTDTGVLGWLESL